MKAFRPAAPRGLVILSGLMLALSLLACGGSAGASDTPSGPSIPAMGTATTLDLATWNLEWFGDAGNGPADEALQQLNAKAVMAGLDCDLWALEEVVSASAFQALLNGLSGYAGVLASDAAVTNGSTSYGSWEQKVALVYKTSLATFETAQVILTAHDDDFAGRPPLEVRLRVNLAGTPETLYVICLHAKAGSDSASYQRRANAAAALKTYLDTTRAGEKVFVLGDLNDDLDASITSGQPSPYQAFVADTTRWLTPTKTLSDNRISSLLSYPDPVDHHLASQNLAGRLVAGSVQVFAGPSYITAYGTTTSDHLPVVTRWTAP